MSFSRRLAFISCCLLLAGHGLAQAQLRPLYFDNAQYEQLGLEQAWSTQIQIDPQRAAVSGIRLHVIGRESYEEFQRTANSVYEVNYEGKTVAFRANQLDAYGQPLGSDEALRLAEKLEIRLKARGFEPKLESRRVPATVLYVQTDGGTLEAMDAETGKLLWMNAVGTPGHPALTPAADDNYVVAISGSNLHLLDRATGRSIWTRPIGGNPVLGATIAGNHAFLPTLNGVVSGFRLPDDDGDYRAAPPWTHSTGGHVVTLPFVSDTTISWGTDVGLMFVTDTEGLSPSLMYRYNSSQPVYGGGVFLPPDRLVLAAGNGYVSAIKKERGNLIWRFSTGGPIQYAPIADGEQIFVATRDHRLFGIDAREEPENEREQWMIEGVERIIACGAQRLYCLDASGGLLAIDKASGSILGHLPSGGFDLPFVNNLTDRLYLANASGGLICLRELGSVDPTIRIPLAQPEESRATGDQRPSTDEGDESLDDRESLDDDGGFEGFGDDMFDDGGDDMLDDEPIDEEPIEEDESDDSVFDFG